MMIDRLAHVAMTINGAIDSGFFEVPLDDTCKHIRRGDILEYLEQYLDEYFDIELLSPVDRLELVLDWVQMEKSMAPRLRFGVEKNGLCLLMGYLLESIRRSYAECVDQRIRNGLPIIEAPMLEFEENAQPSSEDSLDFDDEL